MAQRGDKLGDRDTTSLYRRHGMDLQRSGSWLVSTKIMLTKVVGGVMIPTDVETEQALERVKVGGVIECEYTNKRNPAFMRKFFALLRVGFDLWEPKDMGIETLTSLRFGAPGKNFKKYRADVTIAAGYYESVFNLSGKLQVVPLSIAFGKMEEKDFSKLYSNTIDVVMRHVPDTYKQSDIDEAVIRIMSFS